VVVGSIVRVPLSGRRVRGYVVQVGHRPEDKLKDVSGVSGDGPIFDEQLRESLQWAALHYVAPLSVLLERAAPPNLPRLSGPREMAPVDPAEDAGAPLSEVARSAAAGRRRPVLALVGRFWPGESLSAVRPVLAGGGSVMVIVATAVEVENLLGPARALYRDRVVGVSGGNARELTGAWAAAQTPGSLVIGTPRIATWQMPGLRLALVVEEGRRAMKDRQTPTLHVRDLMAHRHRIAGLSLVFAGPTPTLEVLAAGAEVIRSRGRAWPLVEVIDRSGESPGSGFLSDRVVASLRVISAEGGRCFVFTHRRLADASMRCTTCRRVRRCGQCGSRLGRVESCGRCGRPTGPCEHCAGATFEEMGTEPERLALEINRRLGHDRASVCPTSMPIVVGTERDLADVGSQTLVVAADVDGLALGLNYRAGEETLRVLARLANKLAEGPGRRMMVQTSLAGSELVDTLKRGDPMPFLEGLLLDRARDGLPPSSEMMAIEIRDLSDPSKIAKDLESLGVSTLGPAVRSSTFRWLLHGSLHQAKLSLRPLVQKWRDSGATVRLDVDPIDL
jgi:primosomal protein N'